jgi:ribose-phosphate pyrophosphokinase
MKLANINIPITSTELLHSESIVEIITFADGEFNVRLTESVRGEPIVILCSLQAPASDNLMKLLLTIDAARRGGAGHILAAIPYFGYARQDRRMDGRTAISAKLVAKMIEEAGANSVYTIDIHSEQTLGFFDRVVVDNEWALPALISRLRADTDVVISPDTGGVRRARKLAEALNCDLVILDKRRPRANEAEIMNVIGDVRGKNCIMIDDIIDTGGTMMKAAKLLKDVHGARSIHAVATHGVLSKFDDFIKCQYIDNLIITDSVSSIYDKCYDRGIEDRVGIVSIVPMIAMHVGKVLGCLR